MSIDREKLKRAAEAARERIRLKAAQKQNPAPQYIEPVEHTGDAEEDSKAELSELESGFRKRSKDEGRRFELATDTEYWCAICFQTRAQKEAFLQALDIIHHGDKYLDGRAVAKSLGIALPQADVPYNDGSKVDPVWVGFTGDAT